MVSPITPMAKERGPAISAETRQAKAKLGLLFRKRTSLTAPHRNSSHQVGCAGLKPAPLLLKFFRQASIAASSLSHGPASMIHFVHAVFRSACRHLMNVGRESNTPRTSGNAQLLRRSFRVPSSVVMAVWRASSSALCVARRNR